MQLSDHWLIQGVGGSARDERPYLPLSVQFLSFSCILRLWNPGSATADRNILLTDWLTWNVLIVTFCWLIFRDILRTDRNQWINLLLYFLLIFFHINLCILVKRDDFGGKRRQKNGLDLESRVLSRCKPTLQGAPIYNFANIFGEKPVVDLGVASFSPIFLFSCSFRQKLWQIIV